MILHIFTVILLIPTIIIAFYYLILTTVAIVYRKKNSNHLTDDQLNQFAIIIPAHNESKLVYRTISSCNDLNYPIDKFSIFVIADNCTDLTAAVSKKAGANVFERFDKGRRGKGFALEWAFNKLNHEKYDAFLILDADCIISKNALSEANLKLAENKKVLQLNNTVANPDDSPISYTLAVGNYIENHLYYNSKSILGLAVFLRGTGMVFHRDILKKYPWRSTTIAEDSDYTIRLISNNIAITFIENEYVASEFPSAFNQLSIQRERWAGGNISLGKKYAAHLICQGFRNKKLRIIDAGWTFLINSRPIVLSYQLLLVLITYFNNQFFPSGYAGLFFSLALSSFFFTILYFVIGMIRMGITIKRLIFLFQTPLWVYKLFSIAFRNLICVSKSGWNKTPR